jgi:hypothetical protein
VSLVLPSFPQFFQCFPNSLIPGFFIFTPTTKLTFFEQQPSIPKKASAILCRQRLGKGSQRLRIFPVVHDVPGVHLKLFPTVHDMLGALISSCSSKQDLCDSLSTKAGLLRGVEQSTQRFEKILGKNPVFLPLFFKKITIQKSVELGAQLLSLFFNNN